MDSTNELEPFDSIIRQGLLMRRSMVDGLKFDSLYKVPRYIVRMCDALVVAIRETGNATVTLADVLRLEGSCTGADYHRKLSLRIQRLSQSGAASR